MGDVLRGYIPSTEIFADSTMLYLALGIMGATVMPHNLYVHSHLVKDIEDEVISKTTDVCR